MKVEDAATRIMIERKKQRDKGFDASHDRHHCLLGLERAALAYLLHSMGFRWIDSNGEPCPPPIWPLDACWWKPKTPSEDRIRAAALIAAAEDAWQTGQPIRGMSGAMGPSESAQAASDGALEAWRAAQLDALHRLHSTWGDMSGLDTDA